MAANTVLFVHQSAEMYGSDKVLLFIAKELREKGLFHPVVVLPESGPLHDALLACGVEVHIGEVAKISRAIFSPFGLLRLAWQLLQGVRFLNRVFSGRQVAVVHSNTLAVLSGAVWAFLRNKKHLWHVHEIILSPKLVSRVFPYLANVLSDRVMSNSTLTEQWLISEQPSLEKKSVVVFNGLPSIVEPSRATISAFRERIGADASDVVVTLAGRINRWKGQDLLLDAIAELKRKGQAGGLRFVIVGSTAPGMHELENQLKAKAVSVGCEAQCSFIPFIDDIWPVWFASDIGVVPSTEPEPFGMVAIEAMAAGKPVIAAGHGGLLDIVVHEETGILFAPRDAVALADAIHRLASDKAMRHAFGKAGVARQRALFSVTSQVERTSAIYKEMIS